MTHGLLDRRALRGAVALLVACTTLAIAPASADAATIVTQTFSYTGAVQTFTVPSGVSSITVTMAGGQGGRGGGDSQGSPTPGGYRGTVTGVIAVTPGQQITIAVGGGGGTGVSSRGSAAGGAGGQNPLDGYDGAVGGVAGPAGSSGGGGGSGAATVVRIDGVDVVAGGAGGNGGNGQFVAIVGRRAEESHLARPDLVSTVGRPGLNTILACSPGFNCDGGASGAGGGGAQGGEQGSVQYGGALNTEYFGFGGYPGANDTAGLPALTAGYEYYAGNSAGGTVVFSYDTGTPGAPSAVTGTTLTGAVALSWDAPSAGGSSAITDYVIEYATNAGGPYVTFADGTSTDLETTVTGLTNGVTYYFRVAAVNSHGTGPTSPAMTIGVMPSDVPNAPVIVALVPFDSGIHVDFTPGATHSAITGYEYRVDGGLWSGATATANRLTIAGLTNGQTYAVEIRSLNVIGASAPSAPASAMPRAVPGAPSALVAVAANATVALSWTAPAANNGAAVTDYVVQVAPSIGGTYITFVDGTSITTAASVTGLANATTYYFRVAAVNAVGIGAYSPPAGATPFTTPGAPTIATITPGDGTLTVDFVEPFDGGSAITKYEYRVGVAGAWSSTESLDDQFVIGALTNGTSYSVSVRATNAAGIGAESSSMAGAPRTVPAPPSIAAVALDTGAVSVTFTMGADGGSPITNVEYSIDGGDNWITRSPAGVASPLTIGSLVGGQTYAVRLRAVNAAGVSGPSNESLVTAKGAPEAPVVSGLVESDRALTVLFAAPPNGGTPITNYEYSLDGGLNWSTRNPVSASAPLVVSGLVNGTAYSVRLRAVNAVGSGAASATVVGTPRTTPSAPTIDADTIVGVDGALDVVFTAPVSDGGSPIFDYQYSTDAGVTWRTRATGFTASPLRITTLSLDGITPLTGGATYPVEIRAVNAAGPGVASAVATGITTTVPAAPVIDTVAAHDSSAAITFTNPANGGAAIIRFEYRLDGGGWVDTGTLANQFVIGGLTNSTTYAVEVRAVNSVGNGPASAPVAVSVRTTPGAPVIGGVTAGDQTLSVAFTPGPDGGSAITNYQYSTDGGVTWRTRTDGTTASPLLITSTSVAAATLTNGTVYAVQIRAVNEAGAGDASLSQLVAPRGAPAAPTAVALNPGDGRLTVTFTAGADGGSSITGIDYRIGTGAWIDTGSLNSPFTIAGLVNGTAYDITVRARNAIGAGPASTTANATPRTVPSAPGAVTATGADSASNVSWTAPVSNGGALITGYVANVYLVPSDGSPVASCATSGALACMVTGLTNGTGYYVAVHATNAAGAGSAGSPRVAVTPVAPPLVAIASLNPGANDIAVDVNVLDTGGAAITTFEYRLDGGAWQSAATANEPFTIGGLVKGTPYVVQIRAVNLAGTGPASAPATATPRSKPSAPGALVAVRGSASVALSWDTPVTDGGQPITDYAIEYGTNAGGPFTPFVDGTSTATSATVTGLLNGTAYVFRVAAVNVAGAGTPSGLAAATPLAPPSAPTITTIGVGSQYLQVFFTAPANNGGSAVTAYEYQLDGGVWRTNSATSSPMTIAGLTNGHTYQVALRAVNVVGPGVASNTMSAKPYGLPGEVAGFIATPGSGSATLSWDAVYDNGSPITAYNIVRWSAATEGSIVLPTFQTTNTSYTVTGLTNGATYYFTIEAINAAGTGPRSSPRTSVRVGGVAPAAPALGAVVVTGDQVSMAWTPGAAGDAAISGYIVQYSTNGTTHVTLAMHSPTAASTTVQVPSVDAPFSLRVAHISSVGAGAFATVRPPLATTGQVSAVDAVAATVDAMIHANTSTVTTDFEIATSVGDLGTGAASLVTATPPSVSGPTAIATSAALALEPGTTYYVRARATSPSAITRGATRTFTTPAMVTSTDLEHVYSGAPVQIVTVTEPAGLTVARTYEGIGATVYPISATPPTAAGTYRVTATVVGLITGGDVATVTIAPKPVTVAVTASGKSYDGTTNASLTFALHGVVDGDDVAIDAGKIKGKFATADAIANQVVTINADPGFLSGAAAANYTASMPNAAVASIARATQGLWFSSIAPESLLVGSTYAPTVVSSAGLTADLAIAADSSLVCSVSGAVIVALAEGTCVIVATQAGTENVEPALAVTQSFVVPVAPAPTTPVTTAPVVVPPAASGPLPAASTPSPVPSQPLVSSPFTPVASSGQPESVIAAAARATERDNRSSSMPFAGAMLGAAIFAAGMFFILAKRRWSRDEAE